MMNEQVYVMKFGGTSVGTADAVARTARILADAMSDGHRIVAVVSAMSGVTTNLLQGIVAAARGDAQMHVSVVSEILARYDDAVEQLIEDPSERRRLHDEAVQKLADYTSVCESVTVLREATPRAMDRALSCGEPLVVLLLASLLCQMGCDAQPVDATSVIVTDAVHQDAMPQLGPTSKHADAILRPLLEARTLPVLAGFIGATQDGDVTTLGRGGSDFSASVLAAVLDADEVWIWTDVDGVMTADPRLVPEARIVPVLSYGEVGELAYFGAKVLHPRTIRPLIDKGTPLRIKNTFRPSGEGTRIQQDGACTAGSDSGAVKAVTHVTGLSMIVVEGRGMLGVPGVAARTFEAVARCKTNVLMISQASSEQSICFVIPADDAPCVIGELSSEFELELARRDIDHVRQVGPIDIVTALADGIRNSLGTAACVFSALSRQGVNISAIAQGSSKYSISVAVSSEDFSTAVRAIHEEVVR